MSVLEIRKTDKSNKGLYSLVHFDNNQVILKFNGKLISTEIVSTMSIEKAASVLQVAKNKYLDLSGDISLFIQHSCNPNTSITIMANTAFLVATRHISPDEELRFDYSTTSTDPIESWNMNCNCGEWNCRKVISGFNSLSDNDKKRYAKFIPSYVKNQ